MDHESGADVDEGNGTDGEAPDGGGSRSTATATGDGTDLTAHEEATLRRVRGLSHLLDEAFRVPGTDFRVGLDPILGILPVGGDAIAAAFSLYPVAEAYRLGASEGTLAKMLVLVAIDAVIGSVPFVGPVFDAFWKANEWNVRALERHLGVA